MTTTEGAPDNDGTAGSTEFSHSAERLEKAKEEVSVRPGRISRNEGSDRAGGACAHGGPLSSGFPCEIEGPVKSWFSRALGHPARPRVLNQLGGPSDVCDQARATREHGFDDGDRQPLLA